MPPLNVDDGDEVGLLETTLERIRSLAKRECPRRL